MRERHRPELTISVILAFTLFGDSLLYNILPLYAESLGIPLFSVGILLSINRWVRLFSNSWASTVFQKYGLFTPFLITAFLGMLSTFGYVLPGGVIVFLVARLLWGICWSHLRLGGFLAIVAATAPARLGAAMGWMHAITRLGSAFTVLFGGLLVDSLGYHQGVFIMATLSGLAVVLVWWSKDYLKLGSTASSSNDKDDSSLGQRRRTPAMTPLFCNASIFLVSLVNSGLIMSSLSLLLRDRIGDGIVLVGTSIGIATISGLLLSLRWISAFLVSPVVGGLTDRFGRRPVYLVLSVIQAGTLVVLAMVPTPMSTVLSAVLLFFAGNSLKVVLDAAISDSVAGMDSARLIGVFNSSSDFGAASGPILGYALAAWVGFANAYLIGAALLLGLLAKALWDMRSHSGRKPLSSDGPTTR